MNNKKELNYGTAISGQVKKQDYWYMYDECYCPVCGRSDIYKQRIYDKPKPNDYNKRHIIQEAWDYCGII